MPEFHGFLTKKNGKWIFVFKTKDGQQFAAFLWIFPPGMQLTENLACVATVEFPKHGKYLQAIIISY